MNLAESMRIALRAITANKVRSALTMLGVIIGVAAVILLVGIGTGMQDEITGSIEGLGSNLLFVVPGSYGDDMESRSVSSRSFTMKDAETIRKGIDAPGVVVPIIQTGATVKAGNKSVNAFVAAADENGSQAFTGTVADGRFYRRSEVQAESRVVVLGSRVASTLFPNQDPLGKTVSISGQRFTVIGHFESMGGGMSGDQDSRIYMPITTAQKVLGIDDLSMIIAKAERAEDVEVLQKEIERALKPTWGSGVTVFSQEQTLGVLSDLMGTITYVLAGIAGISLLVGGIGIMNIMLVSVSERTREIGIRKAVGARTHDILSQFVIEAVALSVTGGIIGVIVGWGGALLISSLTPVPSHVTTGAIALSFSFAFGVGVFFGVYPAWKASQLDPIVALRYE